MRNSLTCSRSRCDSADSVLAAASTCVAAAPVSDAAWVTPTTLTDTSCVPSAACCTLQAIAWVAARCDPPHYGELIAYEFPKDKLVFGPFQIEARINQNTAISQQLSLWNQQGSRVIRGALHAIPIDNSILYVSPLYLRAESGQIPELKRVIAAYGDQVAMEETLAEALAVLFKPLDGKPGVGNVLGRTTSGKEALDHYYRAMERLKLGDWAGFGGELDQLRAVLEGGRMPR